MAGGEAGVDRMLQIVSEQIERTMRLLDDSARRSRSSSRGADAAAATGANPPRSGEGAEFQARAQQKITAPALTVGGFGGPFTEGTVTQIVERPVDSVLIEGVGHYVALEAPDRLAAAITAFLTKQD